MRGMIIGVLLLLLAACAAPAPTPAGLDGDWRGTIEVPGMPLEIGLTFTGDTGTLAIPTQGVTAMPVRDVRVDGATVSFAVPDVTATFAGTLDGDRMTGDYTQAGRSAPFALDRGILTAPARPQEPQPPYPYAAEELTFPSGDVTRAGTLTLPEGPGPHPAVVLITGSGAQDRDENIGGHRPFLLLADTLTRAGFAVLRTDDRGVGGSTGVLTEATYDQLADDALAGVALLRERPDIDPTRVGLFGHSEGGYLGPLAASRGDVAFVVSMAGPAVSGADVFVEQSRLLQGVAGVPQDQIEQSVAEFGPFLDALRAGDRERARAVARDSIEARSAALPEDQRPDAATVDAQVQASMDIEQFLLYDPAPALRALRVPVLAFFGDRDLQVPSAQSEGPMRTLLAENPDVTVRTFPGLNHLMQPTATGSPAEYETIETTIDPAVLDLVRTWMVERFG